MSFDFKKDPFDNFLKSYKEAQLKGVPDANAMALATVNKENQPSVRIVFFKEFFEKGNNRGFCFYTNYHGRKAQDMDENPKVSANFFWPHLDHQIRIEGTVEKVPREISEKYFATRPRASQIGAWASAQSEKIESYGELVERTLKTEQQFKGQSVPCPPHWGGYCLFPHEIEFWFGRVGRLHERYVYQRENSSRDLLNDFSGPAVWLRFMRSP